MKEPALTSLKRSLPILVPVLVLGLAPLAIGFAFGRGWRLVAAVISVGLWFLIRPWRFGLTSPDERRQARITGTIGLCGLVVNYIVVYYKL